MKFTIAVVLTVVAAVAGYFGIRRLTHKGLALTTLKQYATKLAKTLLHTEATAAQEAGVASAA
jgi:CHASE3 domain sensor protein